MRKDMKKGSVEWSMFRDFWLLCCEFWIPEETDQYWNDVSKAADKFAKKYKEDDFVVKLAIAFLDNLDSKRKSKNI